MSTKLKKRMDAACAELHAVLAEARKENPGAEFYCCSRSLHLMSGPHHDDKTNSDITNGASIERQDRIIHTSTLETDVGDW